jgi:hypothetical protein
MRTTKHFALTALLVLGSMLGASTPARAGGQIREYNVVPVNGVSSGGGWVRIQVWGPVSERGLPEKWWGRTIEGGIVFPAVGVYYVYFDSVLVYVSNEFDTGVDLYENATYPAKPLLPKVISAYDADGNLVLSSK